MEDEPLSIPVQNSLERLEALSAIFGHGAKHVEPFRRNFESVVDEMCARSPSMAIALCVYMADCDLGQPQRALVEAKLDYLTLKFAN